MTVKSANAGAAAPTAARLGRVRIVLVGTSHPGNIGAAARAMKTMGLRDLALVAPESFPHAEASARAAGADDVLDAARVVDDVDAAIADCVHVLGCTARRRGVALPEATPREAAVDLLSRAAGGPVALLFGRERSGLTNDELQRCHGAVHIPTAPDFGSLNLAAAVQVLAYELRQAAIAAPAPPPRRDAPADAGEIAGLFEHLDRALHAIDFHKGRSPDTVMRRLRRLFLRAELDRREVRILRGILADAERMAALARGRR